jgi:hypothetical protein
MLLQLLTTDNRDSYKKLAVKIQERKPLKEWKTICKNRVITIKNAVIIPSGMIINPDGIWFMGGCVKERKITREQALHYYYNIVRTQPCYKKIISIAALWANGVWHFPMEALVALKLIHNFEDTYLHITQKSKLCLSWINLVNINISPDRIIDNTIYAEELILPEMGLCGNPYYDQLLWLRDRVHYSIPDNSLQNLFILIKRNARRSIKNHAIIENICKNFCKQRNLQFYLHDDLFLPPLKEQMAIFNKAKVIIGPHGGGGTNLVATKNTTCFIEFLNTSDINLCYTRIAYLLNIEYFGITYDLSEGVNIKRDLIPTLNKLDKFLLN